MFLNIKKRLDRFLCINILCIIAVIALLFFSLRFSYIHHDDLGDLIVRKNFFNHGRFISLFLQYFIVRNIPFFFNINVQDFAFFSIAVPLVISYTLLTAIMCNIFIKEKLKNPFWGPAFILLTFTIVIFLNHIYIPYMFRFSVFIWGYFLPMPFIIYFWHKVLKIYQQDVSISKICLVLLCLISVFIAQASELTACITGILLMLLFFDMKIRKKSGSKKILYFLLIFVLSALIIRFSAGHKFTLESFYDPRFNPCDLTNAVNYLKILWRTIILDNIISIVFTFLLSLYILFKKSQYNSVVLFIIYAYCAILSTCFILYPFGANHGYDSPLFSGIQRFLILIPTLFFQIKLLLFSMVLYLFRYLDRSILLASIYILLHFIIYPECINLSQLCPSFTDRQTMYIADKLSIFYLKRGLTAIVPKDGFFVILPGGVVHKNPDPKEIYRPEYFDAKDADLDEKLLESLWYNEKRNNGELIYLYYLKKVYGVDINPGMTYRSLDEALALYEEQGGRFEEDELKKLDFSKIAK